jgi:hypothetical protein
LTIRRPLTTIAFAFAVAGCSILQASPHSVISTGPDGLRTFTWFTESNGMHFACAAFALVDPVRGTLHGDASDPQEPIWIENAAGRRLSVVWPAGFTVTFEPDAVLRDDRGTVMARANGPVKLDQVRPEDHAGSFEDPYIASGGLFQGCYPFLP